MKNTSRKRGLLSFLTRTRKKFSPIKWSPPKDIYGNEIKFHEQLLLNNNSGLINHGPRPITGNPRFAHLHLAQRPITPLHGDPRTRDAHYRPPVNLDDYGKGKKSKRRRPTKRRPTKRRKSKKR